MNLFLHTLLLTALSFFSSMSYAGGFSVSGSATLDPSAMTNGMSNSNQEGITLPPVVGASFTIQLPTLSSEDVKQMAISPLFSCESGFEQRGWACVLERTTDYTTTCVKPPRPSTPPSHNQCHASWRDDLCAYSLQCGSNGNSAGGGGNGYSEYISGTVTKHCPSGYELVDNKCEAFLVKSVTPHCKSGWTLGLGGYACIKR